jgi:hypothetical protein
MLDLTSSMRKTAKNLTVMPAASPESTVINAISRGTHLAKRVQWSEEDEEIDVNAE